MSTIIYTHTDEAPLLATYSLLPIIEAYAKKAGVEFETRDISLAGRIIAQFPERLTEQQRIGDALAELGELADDPTANIIKLPNISASAPQLKAAIAELQAAGFDLPDLPEDPQTEDERDVAARYDRVMGSAVNPVLRQGNSDRRAPGAVKSYAKAHPHRMGAWSADSRTRVATMGRDDFFSNEKSYVSPAADTLRIEHVAEDGTVTVLKDTLPVLAGEVIDATFMNVAALDAFLAEQVETAKADGVLFSAHLKATMMKVSDPILFGHVVEAYFASVFAEHGEALAAAGLRARDGLGSIFAGLEDVQGGAEIRAAFEARMSDGPELAMVNSDKGITGLHVPSDVIIDASMPAMIRGGGKMWGPDGNEAETLAVIPDSSYAGVYQAAIDDCKANGALDPTTMGTVPNVGLMAQKAEEYGSHDKTFELAPAGIVRIVTATGDVVISHEVAAGDVWRACQTKDAPIRDWVKLAVTRARLSEHPCCVLARREPRPRRQPDRQDRSVPAGARHGRPGHPDHGAGRGDDVLARADPPGSRHHLGHGQRAARLQHRSLPDPRGRHVGEDAVDRAADGGRRAVRDRCGRLCAEARAAARRGGLPALGLARRVLRDSRPPSEHFAQSTGNAKAQILADDARCGDGLFLENDRSPGRKLGTIDNRGSPLLSRALLGAGAGAGRRMTQALAAAFAPIAESLSANEQTIVDELVAVQGNPTDIGGYYRPDDAKATAAMRPSATLNAAIDGF